MRERIESKHVTKEIKSQMPVIPVEIVKERGCTFCPYYLGNYEKQPRCMMKIRLKRIILIRVRAILPLWKKNSVSMVDLKMLSCQKPNCRS